jgi:hypothetical protein
MRLQWASEDHWWGLTDLPPNKAAEFKVLLRRRGGTYDWDAGKWIGTGM